MIDSIDKNKCEEVTQMTAQYFITKDLLKFQEGETIKQIAYCYHKSI